MLYNRFLFIPIGTVCRLLDADRDSVPDAPAIYFVMPTRANIARICQVNAKFALVMETIDNDPYCVS